MKFGAMLLAAGMALSPMMVAAEAVDLKQNMKAMKLEFKQAAEAQSIDEMQRAVATLSQLVEDSKRGQYPQEKNAIFQEGFNKLTVALDTIEEQLQQGELEKAKSMLKNVDALREEYHDKRNPSIWSKLFG